MPTRAVRLGTFLTLLRALLPAWLFFLLSAVIHHPISLVFLLIANALTMTAVCHVAGFDIDARLARSAARRGVTYFVLLTGYTAFVALVLVVPAWWLSREGSMAAALVLSGALAAGLLTVWRVWPAFALPFLWDDAYPHDDDRGSWLLTALRRCIAFARHLTERQELFFRFGLPAGISLLVIVVGALTLAVTGALMPEEVRLSLLALYGILVAPLAHALLANRSVRALLADKRRESRTSHSVAEMISKDCAEAMNVPLDASRAELDAMLLGAAHSAQINLALAALDRGADPNVVPVPNQRDRRGVLLIAVTMPDLRLLRALIAKGADVNLMHGGITPLIAATRDSYEGRPETVTTLIANGADACAVDAGGNSPLHHAAYCGDPAIAALLLDASARINDINSEGMTALCLACTNANWRVVSFLLERGASVDVEHAQPALVHAAGVNGDDPTGVDILIAKRAAVDVCAPLGRTALMTAALAGHNRIVEALLAADANPDAADHHGITALMESARSGSVPAIHALGRHNANANAACNGGRTALIIACQGRHGSEETVRALLALGADRARTDNDGKRALEYAAAAGRWHIVALLDPAYPLPSNLGGGRPIASTSADHLLDALRFGHWNVAAEFVGLLADWPAETLADLYKDLVDPEHGQARAWLLNHGLGHDATVGDGRHLIDVLTDNLPAACAALGALLQHGVAVGGSGRVARVLACASDDAAGAEVRGVAGMIMDCGGDCHGVAAGQRSALHLAVAQGGAELAARLLASGVDPDACDAQGATPLHQAVQLDAGKAEPLLKHLIRAGANPEIAAATGETPLGLALARNEPEFAIWLNWTNWRLPWRPLRDSDLPAAASMGDLDAVERLIVLGLSLDGEDAQGATALIRAAGSGHASMVVRLLELGADTAHAAHSGIHCLAAAVSARRNAAVRTLLNHGVPADMRMAGGGTALVVAAALGEVVIAEALLEAGADVNAADDQGTTALHAAAQYAFDRGDEARAHTLLDLFLKHGARLEACNAAGQDPLLVLLGVRTQPGTPCDGESLRRLSKFLVESGAKLDLQDQRGVGVLHACALHGLFGCARLLKAAGAPLDLLDGFGRSAADVASLLGFVDVAAELGAERASPLPSVRQTLRRPAR